MLQDVIDRVQTAARNSGLDPVSVGGVYDLQRQLGELIASSLRVGLGGLLALFLLIGLEVLVMRFNTAYVEAALMAIPIVIIARTASVSLPILLPAIRRTYTRGTIPVLVWGGSRGGISVALALSIPAGPERDTIVAVTYIIVVCSIVFQGLTIQRLVAFASHPK